MKQITKGNDLIGKTVANVVYDYEGNLALILADDSYVVFSASSDLDGNLETYLSGYAPSIYSLKTFGIISDAEYDRRLKAKTKEHSEARERVERNEYERLKLKFEGSEG